MLLRFWLWLTTLPDKQERSPLEQELLRRIDYLETELLREREHYRQVMERLAFPVQTPIAPSTMSSVQPAENPARAESRRLSMLSKQRLDAQIEEMEQRARTISQRDAELSRQANREDNVNAEETKARSSSKAASWP